LNRLLALWQSTIGKKIAMAVSGILLVLFLLSHMFSNVFVLFDPAKLDAYAEWLRGFGPLLWVLRAGLLAVAVIHVLAAWQLTQRARAARPDGYAEFDPQVASYASRTMRWGGVLILVFLVYHLLHFTFGTVHPDFRAGEVGRNLIVGMQVPAVAVVYLIAMAALGLHLWHGTWSVFQTLGLNHPAWNATRRVIGILLALVIAGGFLTIPLAALFGRLVL
jgi:succinate dehydrogenase / fumarate reductase cytochrome b subunit